MTTDDAQFTFGEVPVTARVHSAQEATPETLAKLASKVWDSVRKSKVRKADEEGNRKLLDALQQEHKDFATTFPLVLRWMVQARQFNTKAFMAYALKHAKAELKTPEDFLRLQAEYLVLLYRETQRHPPEAAVTAYREAVIEQLLEEHREFHEMQKKVEDEMALQAREADQDRRQRLYVMLMAEKVKREAAAGATTSTTAIGATTSTTAASATSTTTS